MCACVRGGGGWLSLLPSAVWNKSMRASTLRALRNGKKRELRSIYFIVGLLQLSSCFFSSFFTESRMSSLGDTTASGCPRYRSFLWRWLPTLSLCGHAHLEFKRCRHYRGSIRVAVSEIVTVAFWALIVAHGQRQKPRSNNYRFLPRQELRHQEYQRCRTQLDHQ